MYNHLKMFELQVYIDELTKISDKDDEEEKWMKDRDLTQTTIKIYLKSNVYTNIENMTNANKSWKILEENFQPRGSEFLNDSFRKLDNLKLGEYTSRSDYSSKFC